MHGKAIVPYAVNYIQWQPPGPALSPNKYLIRVLTVRAPVVGALAASAVLLPFLK